MKRLLGLLLGLVTPFAFANEPGVLFKGQPEASGKYVVIYDISDLTYEVPNFAAPEPMTYTLGFIQYDTERYNHRYRHHYRNDYNCYNSPHRSYTVFNYAQPMYAPPRDEDIGPKYSKEREKEILEMINAVVGNL